MIRGKLIATVALAGLLCVLIGCERKPAQGDPPTPNPQPPGTPPQPKPQPDLYELDPAKHKIPDAPATGRLAGQPFTPNRFELEDSQLIVRQGKDFFADLSIVFFLGNKKNPAEGLKLVIRPDQKWTDGVPTLHVSTRKGKDLPETKFVNDGYALTLELGKFEKRKSAGKIYLCLPDAEKSVLAGTFTVERKRSLSEPPGDEEVPFIQGTVSPPVKKDQFVSVGYVGLPAEKKTTISDGAGGQVFGDEGSGGGVRSMSFAPRMAGLRFEKFTPKFDFTNLPPGRYLIYARVRGGPTAWKWVELPAGGKVTADLKFDEKNAGTVEVKLPPDQKEVRLVPTDPGAPPGDHFLNQLAFALDLKGEVKDGKAVIAHVPAGKYQVRAGLHWADVEVTAGKTATIELKPAKK